MIVRMVHVREAGFCAKGARAFFKKHNLDWSNFLKHGIDSEILLRTGDAMALQVVRCANG